jgi:hypothetical protein
VRVPVFLMVEREDLDDLPLRMQETCDDMSSREPTRKGQVLEPRSPPARCYRPTVTSSTPSWPGCTSTRARQ